MGTGVMIFVSVMLAGVNRNHSRAQTARRWAWGLGLGSQLLLYLFGVLEGHPAFTTHLLVASAFAINLARDVYNQWWTQQRAAADEDKKREDADDWRE